MRRVARPAVVVAWLLASACHAEPAASPETTTPRPVATVVASAPASDTAEPELAKVDDTVSEDDAGASASRAPDFSLASVNAGPARIDPGKVVILSFGASWCAPCKALLPELEALRRKHSASDFAVVALMEDDDAKDVSELARKAAVSFPVAWDRDRAVAMKWNLTSLPSEYVIDRRGVVRYVHAGYAPEDDARLEREVTELLGER